MDHIIILEIVIILSMLLMRMISIDFQLLDYNLVILLDYNLVIHMDMINFLITQHCLSKFWILSRIASKDIFS